MRSKIARLMVAVFVVLLFWSRGVDAAPSEQLDAQIHSLISQANAEGAFWGIFVHDVETGTVLYRMNDNKPMMPASNQKLLTAAGALEAVGPNFRYRTILFLDGQVHGSRFEGDLIIRGSGDPSFGSRRMPGPDPLRTWARRLAEIGITSVSGRIIGDDSAFADEIYAAGWDIDYITNQPSRMLGTSISGLAYNDNSAEIRIRSTRPGSEPTITFIPSDYLTVDNQLTTSSRTRGVDVNQTRIVGEERIRLRGSVPRSYEGSVFMPVTNPTRFAIHTFARFLQSEGIEVQASLYDVDELVQKPSYDGLEPLFVHFSPPMSEILRIVNKASNNFYAEQVLRTFGYGGSAAGAERRLKELLRRAGADVEAVSIRDGSGLSRKDLITPEALGRLLTYVRRQPYGAAFIESLPSGGEPQSTLRFRLGGAPVQAKTGSLEFVRALSGYTTLADGRTVSFVVMANHFAIPSYRVVQTIDQIVTELNRFRPA